MVSNPTPQGSDVPTEKAETLDDYVKRTYKDKIDYYWRASSSNKKNFKRYRYWTTILGSLVTLVASLTTSAFIQSDQFLALLFTVSTPILAAILTVISGISQNFQWGATWRDMVVNAQRLEKERDRFLATALTDRDYVHELHVINETIMDETQSFFQRVLDSEVIPARSAPSGQKV
ncbi:MAG: DUF4231 domain-containing protein [Chloroflexota bacterium]